MRGWTLGVLSAVLCLAGCGKTDEEPGPGAAGSGQGAQGTGGAQAMAGGSATAGGEGMKPMDGEFPSPQALHKLDLLLMVDNSQHMAVKQRLLADAVKWLLTPGSGPQLSVDDIHIGVVTSSLGAHGAAGLRDVCTQASDDDHAHLLASVRPNLASFRGSGFLAWGPGAEPSITNALADLEPMVLGGGQSGCGYEASLEAWYRFLIDPTPPLQVTLTGNAAAPTGIDATLLSQRQAFLRPDSVVSIVLLSDENDCSIVDRGFGWLTNRAEPMYASTSACANPNDPCCQSCGEPMGRAGCPAPATDAACSQGTTLPSTSDELSLRCWEQKRRFGFDFLQPLSRYRDGLKSNRVLDASDTLVQNPLFAGGVRHPSQVIFTGIVGVPWQDLAEPASLTGPGLTYLSASVLASGGYWDSILGDPTASPPVPPADPFMLETPDDRSLLAAGRPNPYVSSEGIVAAGTTMNPQANHINGHETLPSPYELQAACTFALETPLTCDAAAKDSGTSCYCFENDLTANRAVCQPPQGGPAATTQYYTQAYPGLRHLQLMKELGDTAVVASICPKVLDSASPDYGYRPAMKAMAALVQHALAP